MCIRGGQRLIRPGQKRKKTSLNGRGKEEWGSKMSVKFHGKGKRAAREKGETERGCDLERKGGTPLAP